jgi:spore coat protein H
MQPPTHPADPVPSSASSPGIQNMIKGWRRSPWLKTAEAFAALALGMALCGPHPWSGTAYADPPVASEAGPSNVGTVAEPVTKEHKSAKAGQENTDEAARPKAEKKAEKAQLAKDRLQQDEFFEKQDFVPYFKFDFLPEEWDYIHKDPRRFAECTMSEGDDPELWKGVAVKLKGAASFQGPDGKPGLTISMAKFQKAERWHGFLKWHLNNGVQDNTFLNEQMSCEIARRAGVPASRCAHALVKWQGRDLGLYVFKESFDRDFLAKFYRNTNGDIYDGGQSPADLRLGMDKDQGDRLREDNVKELMAACRESDPKKRWERLEKILDVDEYISFTAVEAIVCHWDGYNFKTNNYRVYFDADTGKASFWIHGTDQTFGTSDQNNHAEDMSLFADPISMVGQAVMSNPVWKQAYHDRVRKIYKEVLEPFDWPAHVVEVGEKFKAAIALHDPQRAADYEKRITEAHDRMAYRIAGIARQLGEPVNAAKP